MQDGFEEKMATIIITSTDRNRLYLLVLAVVLIYLFVGSSRGEFIPRQNLNMTGNNITTINCVAWKDGSILCGQGDINLTINNFTAALWTNASDQDTRIIWLESNASEQAGEIGLLWANASDQDTRIIWLEDNKGNITVTGDILMCARGDLDDCLNTTIVGGIPGWHVIGGAVMSLASETPGTGFLIYNQTFGNGGAAHCRLVRRASSKSHALEGMCK